MAITQSSADVDELGRYSWGQCHVFAVALHRLTGWPIHLVLDDGDPYWVDPNDDQNWIASTVHAFCVDDQDRFWDIKGIRPRNDVHPEMMAFWDIADYNSRLLYSEDDLKEFVGCWGDEGQEEIDRPMENYNDEDIALATEVIRRAFEHLLPPEVDVTAPVEPVGGPSC